MSDEIEIRPTTYAEWYALEEERDQLRAELSRLRSAPVAVEVPEIEPELTEEPVVVEDFADNGAHSQWRLVDGATGKTLWEEACSIPPSRILKDGEVAIDRIALEEALEMITFLSRQDGAHRWYIDEMRSSLRSGEAEWGMG